MLCGNVCDKLLNKHSFTNACTAEQTYFTALCIWCKKVYYLYACFKDLCCRLLIFKFWRLSVYLPIIISLDRLAAVNALTKDIEHSSKGSVTYRNFYASACGSDLHILFKSVA